MLVEQINNIMAKEKKKFKAVGTLKTPEELAAELKRRQKVNNGLRNLLGDLKDKPIKPNDISGE